MLAKISDSASKIWRGTLNNVFSTLVRIVRFTVRGLVQPTFSDLEGNKSKEVYWMILEFLVLCIPMWWYPIWSYVKTELRFSSSFIPANSYGHLSMRVVSVFIDPLTFISTASSKGGQTRVGLPPSRIYTQVIHVVTVRLLGLEDFTIPRCMLTYNSQPLQLNICYRPIRSTNFRNSMYTCTCLYTYTCIKTPYNCNSWVRFKVAHIPTLVCKMS